MKLKPSRIMANFKPNKLNIVLFFSIILIILLSFVYFRNDKIYINHNDYKKLLNENLITKAHIDGNMIYLTYNGRKYVVLKDGVDLKELYNKVIVTQEEENPIFWVPLYFIFIVILFYILMFYLDLFFKKKKNKINDELKQIKPENTTTYIDQNPINPVISDIKFKDVAGISEVKNELMEIVDFLKNPSKYYEVGIKLPKGVLMVGPPGIGKTLIAKAVAGEADVPFFYQSGASFAEIYVGLGAKRVRELFAKAKANAPSIIFIDEVDAVGKSRGEGRNDERETTLNQLLTEMDGFEDNNGVIVIAATNKIEMIDEALLRPGRFDRRIFISLPNYKDRIEILKIYLKDKNCDVDLDKVSRMTVGFSGAGLATLVNEAAINTLNKNSSVIELADFEQVKNKVLLGSRKSKILTEYEKEIQAFYQGAKALSAYWYSVEFDKIGLLEDKFINTDREIESKTEILNKIRVLLSGSVGLKIYKKDTFTNSGEDLARAMTLAHKMVYEYGMGDNIIPDQKDVVKILQQCFDEVGEMLKTMQNHLINISKQIFVYEYIDFKKTEDIFQNSYEEKQ